MAIRLITKTNNKMKIKKSNLKYGFILIFVFNVFLIGLLWAMAALCLELLNIL